METLIIDKSKEWDETEDYWKEMWGERIEKWEMRSKIPSERKRKPPIQYTKDQLRFEELKLPKKLIETLCINLDSIYPEQVLNSDIRWYLKRMKPALADLQTAKTLAGDQNTYSVCEVIEEQLRDVRKQYGGREEKFYSDNEDEIRFLKIFLESYIGDLVKGFSYRDCVQIKKGAERFFDSMRMLPVCGVLIRRYLIDSEKPEPYASD